MSITRRFQVLLAVALLASACGGVSSSGADASSDGAPNDGSALDAALDADTCPDFVAPAGSLSIHAALCGTSLGFNPNANPTTMNLVCPTVNPNAGTYGAILQPTMQLQSDGCAATTPMSRLLGPAVVGALVQLSTTNTIDLSDQDRLAVRLACTDTAGCEGDVQITGTNAAGQTTLIFPSGGRETIVGSAVVDVDVAIPAALIGNGARINFIAFPRASGTADILFENPHLRR